MEKNEINKYQINKKNLQKIYIKWKITKMNGNHKDRMKKGNSKKWKLFKIRKRKQRGKLTLRKKKCLT